MKTYNYKGTEVFIEVKRYPNGRIALQLFDIEYGFPFMKATLNLPEVDIKDDEAFIKDYSENSGCLRFLVLNKICSAPIGFSNGHPLVKILI